MRANTQGAHQCHCMDNVSMSCEMYLLEAKKAQTAHGLCKHNDNY